jgi:hypothetical protein
MSLWARTTPGVFHASQSRTPEAQSDEVSKTHGAHPLVVVTTQ